MTKKLTFLHKNEEELRAESLTQIYSITDMLAHLTMIEGCMDVIFALLPDKTKRDKDLLALGNLGIRIFNAFASSTKLMLSGY